jgi:hypothetical protein
MMDHRLIRKFAGFLNQSSIWKIGILANTIPFKMLAYGFASYFTKEFPKRKSIGPFQH